MSLSLHFYTFRFIPLTCLILLLFINDRILFILSFMDDKKLFVLSFIDDKSVSVFLYNYAVHLLYGKL